MDTQLSSQEVAAVRRMLDHSAILGVINEYYHALDTRNISLMRNVFAADAEFTVTMVDGTVHTIKGIDAILAASSAVGVFRSSHHGPRNVHLEIDVDRACGNIYAMDALIDERRFEGNMAAGPRLIQHGLRYVDEYQKGPEGWRIRSRRLYLLWQCVISNPALLAELPMPR